MAKFGLVLAAIAAIIGILYMTNNQQKSNQNNSNPSLSSISRPAQTSSHPSPTSSEPIVASQASILTDKGTIVIELYPQEAPNTVQNFLQKAKSGFYNNLTFHRVEDWVVQGGDPLGNGTGGGSIPVEFNNKPFVIGSVGVASRGDGKTQNDAQFFITKTDADWLNGQYTNFGMVTSGMDVVKNLKIGDTIKQITFE